MIHLLHFVLFSLKVSATTICGVLCWMLTNNTICRGINLVRCRHMAWLDYPVDKTNRSIAVVFPVIWQQFTGKKRGRSRPVFMSHDMNSLFIGLPEVSDIAHSISKINRQSVRTSAFSGEPGLAQSKHSRQYSCHMTWILHLLSCQRCMVQRQGCQLQQFWCCWLLLF